MISAVVFDIDQTLWDFHQLRRTGLEACLELLRTRHPGTRADGWDVEDLQGRFDRLEDAGEIQQLGQIRRKSLQEAAAAVAPDDAELGGELSDVYFAHRHGPGVPYPDVVPALGELTDAGYRLGIISNGNSRLDQLGIGGWWDDIVLGPEHGLAKPDPAIYELVSSRMGCDPSTIVCVGDDPQKDVAGAQASGWRGVWNRRGDETLPEGIVPDATIAELTELAEILIGW